MQGLVKVELNQKSITSYSQYTPEIVERLKQIAKPLAGLKVAHINATAVGGGVAEMLYSVIPLQRDLGLDSSWYVIPPRDDYFEVTKSIHNFLQGKKGSLTEDQKNIYLEHNKLIATLLDEIHADVLIIHDPQPAAALQFMKNKPKLSVWRCHIDTSTPNPGVWEFLKPFLLAYDQLIFTTKEFVHPDIPSLKVNLFTPVIDPFTVKNSDLPKDQARKLLTKLGIDMTRPLITQVSRLDPWKDPIGVIEAFQIAKKQIPTLQLAFVGQMADDDPEGKIITNQVKAYANDLSAQAGKTDILFFINLEDNDRLVNAFQVASTIILQKSIREGFALTVAEAMWKEAIVIGGNVGGIKLQIQDGVNGFLTNSIEETAQKIVYAIQNPKNLTHIPKAAHQTVLKNYLTPHLLLNELKLFSKD